MNDHRKELSAEETGTSREVKRPLVRSEQRRSFVKWALRTGAVLPLIVTLQPHEAKAQATGGS